MGQNAPDNKCSSSAELKAVIRDRIQMLKAQLRQKDKSQPQNKRRGVRRPFPFVQRIAPYDSCLPKEANFYEVQCRDISTVGFSFQSTEVPVFSHLVVELGTEQKFAYITARVARTVGQPDGTFLVGCEFIGRVSI